MNSDHAVKPEIGLNACYADVRLRLLYYTAALGVHELLMIDYKH